MTPRPHRSAIDKALAAPDDKLTRSQRSQLRAVAKTLGTEGDDNGITINTGNLPANQPGVANDPSTITLDLKQIKGGVADYIKQRNDGITDEDAAVVAGGAILSHEGDHLARAREPDYDGIRGFPLEKAAELNNEKRAYGVQGIFGQGIGRDVGYWTQDEINESAKGSTSVWCKQAGCK